MLRNELERGSIEEVDDTSFVTKPRLAVVWTAVALIQGSDKCWNSRRAPLINIKHTIINALAKTT